MHTVERLKKFAPKADPALLVAIVKGADVAKAAGITTALRWQHFIAQIAHESGGFKSLTENMNYTSGRLVEVFGARNGLTRQKATALAKQGPEAIANFVYGGAWGKKNLGNTEPNDGWDFRGGGFMQTTGRANYTARGKATGYALADVPSILRDPDAAFAVACKEWQVRGCNAAADKDDLRGVTKRINGGTNGIEDRAAWLARAKAIFPEAAPKPMPIVATYPGKGNIPLPGSDDEDAGLAAWKAKWAGVPRERVRGIQTQLRERGYSEVGDIDGLPGTRLRDALMSFQTDNGLPATGLVDNATAQAFLTGKSRKVSKERAASTTKDVDREVPGALAPARANATTAKAGVGAAVVAGGGSLLGDAVEWLQPVKEFLIGIPVWAWAALIGAAFVGVWFNSDRGKAVLVGLRRSGRLT